MNKPMVQKRKSSKRRNKKLLLLFIVFGISTLAFIGITYAWFVGIGEVSVNSFSVNLKSENSLEISLDGYTWDEELTITENNIKSHDNGGEAYVSNTNSWVGDRGLVPISTSGDNTNGRLNFFTITSLVKNEGGYRILADSLDNYTHEKDYYIAFDIFVKNKSGDVYNPEYNILEDENIYLTLDSSITSPASGANNYGLQNSARVAFVQIGRISLDDLEDDVTPDIKCSTPLGGESYTPLCNNASNHYRTMIWEPNETSHASKLTSYYNYVCKKRTAISTYTNNSCTNIASSYVPTYTVKKRITSSDSVDQYDGLNYYTSNVSQPTETAKYLQQTKTFTDEMKETEGEYTLMKLHPHSVTKIRVYVYLEGQDVDNYDLITNDLNINVNFGFTKEKTYSGQMVEDTYFAKSDDSFVTEDFEFTASRMLVLVYTNTNTPGYTYNGQMMYDLTNFNYKYGETFDYMGTKLTDGVPYSHTYGTIVNYPTDSSLIEESTSPAIKIDRSGAQNMYDINTDGRVDYDDAAYCQGVYMGRSEYFTTANIPHTLYCDVTKDKLVNMFDASKIITNYNDIAFKIDGVTYYAKSNMSWRSWIDSDYNTDGYTLAVSAEMGTPRFVGKPDASGNNNYACGVGYLSSSPDRYSCIFGSGSRIKAIIEIPTEEYNQNYGTIIENHNYITFTAGGSGPL